MRAPMIGRMPIAIRTAIALNTQNPTVTNPMTLSERHITLSTATNGYAKLELGRGSGTVSGLSATGAGAQ